MMDENFLIKKLGHQELGYSKGVPGARGGQYFLMSKEYLQFFPPLKKEIAQHLQILNLVSHGSVLPAQAKYIYNNDKYHGSKAKAPRDEHRINLNKNVNHERLVYLKDDIIIFKKEYFLNENHKKELAYVITRYRESIDTTDYEYLNRLIHQNKITSQSRNYCYASPIALKKLVNYKERLFSRILPKDPIIPEIDEALLTQSNRKRIRIMMKIKNSKTK